MIPHLSFNQITFGGIDVGWESNFGFEFDFIVSLRRYDQPILTRLIGLEQSSRTSQSQSFNKA